MKVWPVLLIGSLLAQALPAAELKVVRATLFPELHSHRGLNLVSVHEAPEGRRFLRVEMRLLLAKGERHRGSREIHVVTGAEKVAPCALLRMARAQPMPPGGSSLGFEHKNPVGYDLLFLVPEDFRNGTIEWGMLKAAVKVDKVGGPPSIKDDVAFQLKQARYATAPRKWNAQVAGGLRADTTLDPPAGAILEVEIAVDPRRERGLWGGGDAPFFAREFSVMIPGRDLTPGFGWHSPFNKEDALPQPNRAFLRRDVQHGKNTGTLLFSVPAGVKIIQLYCRGELLGRLPVK